MSIHTITKEVTVNSVVDIIGPPGANKETVIRSALKETKRIQEQNGLTEEASDVHIEQPEHQDDYRWLVRITSVFRTTTVVELED